MIKIINFEDGLFHFELTEEEEERAKKLHEDSIIIDLLFQGPLSPSAIPDEISNKIKRKCEPHQDDPMAYYMKSIKSISRMSATGEIPQFKDEWYQSGITAGNRQLKLINHETIMMSMADVQLQFDSFDWLMKALTVDDIKSAKQKNLKAGIVTAQETHGLGTNLERLDSLYDFGLRVLQLTYNTQNDIGAGCVEKSDMGITDFGIKFIERLNELGIAVDTGHCGKQTTLEACKYSRKPVIASHTGVENIYNHYRCKSDEEIKAIADTGGVIGVFAMPGFVHDDPNHTTINHVLDHIDYIVNLVGVDHVGIGSDWPMSEPLWSLIHLKEKIAPKLGFEEGDGPSTETIIGLEKYSYFINFTRGLVKRGYSDEDIKKILGGNWLTVFEEIW